jgi:RND family efflux transporter MFP subunit
MRRSQAAAALDDARTDAQLLEMKRDQAVRAIEEREAEIELLEMKRAQTEAAMAEAETDLALLAMRRSQAAAALEDAGTEVQLLEMKRAQAEAAMAEVQTDLELLAMRRSQAAAALEDARTDVELLEMKRAQILSQFADAQAELELLQYSLAEAEENLAAAGIYAAVSGTVSAVNIAAGDQVTAGTDAVRIVDVSQLKAVVEIDEIDMADIAVGQTAYLEFDAVSKRAVTARVSSIPVEGRYTAQGIGVVDVELTIESPPPALKPGFTFAGAVQVSDEGTILAVNREALITLPEGSALLVVQEDGSTLPVPVQTEYLSDGMVRIVSGEVEAGDTVIGPAGEAKAEGAESFSIPGFTLPGTQAVPGTRGSGTGGGTGGARPPESK